MKSKEPMNNGTGGHMETLKGRCKAAWRGVGYRCHGDEEAHFSGTERGGEQDRVETFGASYIEDAVGAFCEGRGSAGCLP